MLALYRPHPLLPINSLCCLTFTLKSSQNLRSQAKNIQIDRRKLIVCDAKVMAGDGQRYTETDKSINVVCL
jgi:hypothetical protein